MFTSPRKFPFAKSFIAMSLGLSLSSIALAQSDDIVRLQDPATQQQAQRQLSPAQQAQIEERMSEVRKRLNLSAEQEEDLAPIMLANLQKTSELMQKYGIQPGTRPRLGIQQMRSLRNDMTAIQQANNREVAKVLDKQQMKEWRKIQKETQDQRRAQFRGRN